MNKKMLFLSVLFLIPMTVCGVALTRAEYPEKRIRYVVAFGLGGWNDIVSRALARYANPYLKGRVYVENVIGAGGAIGFREGARALPDGYTITALASSIMTGPLVDKDYPTYDLFDPLCIVVIESRMIYTRWDGRFKTGSELISYAKAHPGEVTVAFAGIGSTQHIWMAAFEKVTDVQFNLVPYKGDGEGLIATMGGHVDIVFASAAAAVTYVESKKVRPLLAFDSKRYRAYPNIPTVKELGYDMDCKGFSGIGVPKGTPKDVKNILVEAFRKATENEGYKKLTDQNGVERVFWGPEEATPWLKSHSEYFKNTASKLDLKSE